MDDPALRIGLGLSPRRQSFDAQAMTKIQTESGITLPAGPLGLALQVRSSDADFADAAARAGRASSSS